MCYRKFANCRIREIALRNMTVITVSHTDLQAWSRSVISQTGKHKSRSGFKKIKVPQLLSVAFQVLYDHLQSSVSGGSLQRFLGNRTYMTLIYRLPQNIFLSKQINQFSSGDQFGSESFHIELEIKVRSLKGVSQVRTPAWCRHRQPVLLEFPL